MLPYYKTDSILRRINLDRYDDRDIVATNLIDSHDRLMTFVNKWLPYPFYLDESTHRISLRDKIFRKIIANTLIHREFLNHFPAKIIIERNQVVIENGNNANGHGIIDPANFAPVPKNPTIAKFFRTIGLLMI
ncbi:MAG: ATP-dependent helicase RecG [Burkholderiales bacterium]|nr:ATP-dependent helicase RecG [Burkholderiales bacterium]